MPLQESITSNKILAICIVIIVGYLALESYLLITVLLPTSSSRGQKEQLESHRKVSNLTVNNTIDNLTSITTPTLIVKQTLPAEADHCCDRTTLNEPTTLTIFLTTPLGNQLSLADRKARAVTRRTERLGLFNWFEYNNANA